MYMDEDRLIMTILLIYLAVIGTVLLIYLVGYILQGIGMYTMGKRKGMNNSWLAFIPYARVYFQGELAGSIKLKNKEIKNPGIWLLLLPIISGAVGGLVWAVLWGSMMLPLMSSVSRYGSGMYGMESELNHMFTGTGVVVFIVGILLYFLVMIAVGAMISTLHVLVNRQVYQVCTTKEMSIVHAVFGLFIPLYTPICYFVLRERVPMMMPPVNYGPVNGPYQQGPSEPPVPPVQN